MEADLTCIASFLSDVKVGFYFIFRDSSSFEVNGILVIYKNRGIVG